MKRIKYKYLVSLNTATIKLRGKHPRIAEDLKEILEYLKERQVQEAEFYKSDGLLNLEE